MSFLSTATRHRAQNDVTTFSSRGAEKCSRWSGAKTFFNTFFSAVLLNLQKTFNYIMFSSFASFVFHSNSEKKLSNKFSIVHPAELLLSRRPMMLMMMAAVKEKMKYLSKPEKGESK